MVGHGRSLWEIEIATTDNALSETAEAGHQFVVTGCGLRAYAVAAWRRALDFLLPPQCLGCRKRTAEHPGLCPQCWCEMEFIAPPLCDRTGRPFAYDPGPGIVSAVALARPPEWQRARAVAAFGPVSRDLVHALKYRDRLDAATLMGRMMAAAGAELLRDADVIVPVPLYRTRLWHRRFNQSAALARVIARSSGVAVDCGLLHRVRATRAQVGLNTRDRRRNVRGAFAVTPGAGERIAGGRVVLVDDVVTTGATANACAQAMLRAGAEQVDLVTFALVCGPDRVDM